MSVDYYVHLIACKHRSKTAENQSGVIAKTTQLAGERSPAATFGVVWAYFVSGDGWASVRFTCREEVSSIVWS